MSTLPQYSPAGPAPPYSRYSGSTEVSLSFTPPQQSATSSFVHKSQCGTLFLSHQDEGCAQPSYGLHSTRIIGELALEGREHIVSVVAKITGNMDIYTSSVSKMTRLIDQESNLWSKELSSDTHDPCPGLLTISQPLPNSWKEDGEGFTLPPSFHLSISESSDISIRIEYSLQIKITSFLHHRISFLTTTKSIRVPFKYEHRARPWRASLMSFLTTTMRGGRGEGGLDSCPPLSTLKSNPEEWMLISKVVAPRPNGSCTAPLEFILLIPSIQVYSVNDTIPFHLQLLGPEESVRDLFSPHCSPSTAKPVIRLALVRQIKVDIKGNKSWRNIILDQVSFHSVPSASSEENVLNWTGIVRPKNLDVGSFTTKGLNVLDLIVLSVAPPSSKSSFDCTQHHHPIRLVTLPHVEST